MEKIKINTGVKQYAIEDENEETIGVVSVNVTDFNIIDRISMAEKNIMALVERVQKEVPNAQTMEEKGKLMADIDAAIKKELDYMFDSNVSENVFGNKSCLSVCGGQLLITNFLTGIMPVIERDIKQVKMESQKRMGKYLKEYK